MKYADIEMKREEDGDRERSPHEKNEYPPDGQSLLKRILIYYLLWEEALKSLLHPSAIQPSSQWNL